MPPIRLHSAAEQVAAHLREEILRGHWTEAIPGVNGLAAELGVNRKTVESALRQLENAGLLKGQGPGRRRLIVLPDSNERPRPLRVAILLHEHEDRKLGYIVDLQHALMEAGHTAIIPPKAQCDVAMDVKRIARIVGQTEADAWVVLAGSREILEWFVERPEPTFALFGRRSGLPMPATGPDKLPAYAAATRELIKHGHRRIVLLCRQMRLLPKPGRIEHAFLEELAAHGIATSSFNLPVWEETPKGLYNLLDSLFQVTPPTAIIAEEAPLLAAIQQFLAHRGILVPDQVSLVCSDPDPSFAWCKTPISHIRWDPTPHVRRIVRWASTVSRGHKDVRQTMVRAEFVRGGTIGPAPKE